MSNEEYVTITEQVSSAISEDLTGGSKAEIIEIKDASTISAEVLVPQMGSDKKDLIEGKIDTRRWSNLYEEDVLWLSWFSLIPRQYGGEWSKAFCDEYRNHRYSVHGENKKLAVNMQQAVTGGKDTKKDKAKRSLMDKILGRKKDVEYVDLED